MHTCLFASASFVSKRYRCDADYTSEQPVVEFARYLRNAVLWNSATFSKRKASVQSIKQSPSGDIISFLRLFTARLTWEVIPVKQGESFVPRIRVYTAPDTTVVLPKLICISTIIEVFHWWLKIVTYILPRGSFFFKLNMANALNVYKYVIIRISL